MALKHQGSIEIDRAINEVFDYTTNNVAEWSLTVVEDIPLETIDDGGVGSTFRCITAAQSGGEQLEFNGEVIRHEPPNISQSKLVGKMFDIDVMYAFEDLGNSRTRVTQASVVNPKNSAMKVMFGLFGWLMKKSSCKATQLELESLKSKLEA